METLEKNLRHGAIPIHPIHRKLRRGWKKITGNIAKSSIPFNWQQGYDIELIVGPIAIKDQQQSDSCGGQAGSYFLEIQQKLKKVQDVCSAKSVYAPIAYPGGGTTVGALETQIAAHGTNLEAIVPSQPATEANLTDKSWMTVPNLQDALTRAGYTPISVPIDIESIACAIRDYGGVIWEIQGQNNGTWLSPTPLPPSSSNQSLRWQHFMCCKSAKIVNGIQQIGAFNSWGTGIGDGGKQYFTSDYVSSGILDCFTLVPDSTLTPVAGNMSIWAALCLWFKSLSVIH